MTTTPPAVPQPPMSELMDKALRRSMTEVHPGELAGPQPGDAERLTELRKWARREKEFSPNQDTDWQLLLRLLDSRDAEITRLRAERDEAYEKGRTDMALILKCPEVAGPIVLPIDELKATAEAQAGEIERLRAERDKLRAEFMIPPECDANCSIPDCPHIHQWTPKHQATAEAQAGEIERLRSVFDEIADMEGSGITDYKFAERVLAIANLERVPDANTGRPPIVREGIQTRGPEGRDIGALKTLRHPLTGDDVIVSTRTGRVLETRQPEASGDVERARRIIALAENAGAVNTPAGTMVMHWRVQRELERLIPKALAAARREGAEEMREIDEPVIEAAKSYVEANVAAIVSMEWLDEVRVRFVKLQNALAARVRSLPTDTDAPC